MKNRRTIVVQDLAHGQQGALKQGLQRQDVTYMDVGSRNAWSEKARCLAL